MQLPSIDRIPITRPVAVESASLATGKVVPVAPVNSTSQASGDLEPTPSVINMVGQVDKPNFGEGVYTSVSDPTRPDAKSEALTDWTTKKPEPEETKPPPTPPMYQLLIDHLKSLWLASAGSIQVQQVVKDEAQLVPPKTDGAQGVLSQQVFTYSPTKINKTEKTQT
jgi:hypothetical protein